MSITTKWPVQNPISKVHPYWKNNNATLVNMMGLKPKGAAAGPVYITHSRLDDNYLEPLNRHVLSWMVSDEMGLQIAVLHPPSSIKTLNFLIKSHLIIPTKSNFGKISNQFLDRINKELKEKSEQKLLKTQSRQLDCSKILIIYFF